MAKGKIELKTFENGQSGYLSLPDHPGPGVAGCVTKQVRLSDVVKGYDGVDIFIDFDSEGRAIGIELLSDDSELDEES